MTEENHLLKKVPPTVSLLEGLDADRGLRYRGNLHDSFNGASQNLLPDPDAIALVLTEICCRARMGKVSKLALILRL